MNKNLQLQKFDMNSIASDKVVVLIGKRETGKSFLVKDLLYHNQDIPCGTIISGTEGSNQFYSKIFPSLFIHGEYKPELIQNFIKRQKMVIQEQKKQIKSQGDSNIDPRAIIILDDCLYDSTWTKDKNVRSLFMNGRHYKAMFLITMQYSLGIPPGLRTNIDYVFILRESYISNRKRLYDSYAGMFPTFDMFCQVMDQCTENYECLVINNNAKSNRLEDMVFWYKAEERPSFRLGDPIFWKHHKDNFTDDLVNLDEDDLDWLKNKNKPKINVDKLF